MKKLIQIFSLVTLGFSVSAQAALPIAPNTFDFDVIQTDLGLGGSNYQYKANGTSNGVNWNVGANSIWIGGTTTNGTYTGFPALAGNGTDRLHLGSDFQITFDQPIHSLLIFISNNNPSTDSFNFGNRFTLVDSENMHYEPGSAQTVVTNGSSNGGWMYIADINTDTLTHTADNGIGDGWNVAFHVVSVVPEPSTLALMFGGLGLVGLMAARRKN
jgi:hypothetical protein